MRRSVSARITGNWAPITSGWRRISSSGWVISAGALVLPSPRWGSPVPLITTIRRSRFIGLMRVSWRLSRGSERFCFKSSTCRTIPGTERDCRYRCGAPSTSSSQCEFDRHGHDRYLAIRSPPGGPVATRFLSTFLDMSASLNGKRYHVDLLNDPALWNSAPIEPKTPPNPLKNDKEFLADFPYLADPW